MNAKTVRFNAENERSYCFEQYLRRQGGATRHSLPMKQLTAAVLRAELTPLQRFCVTEYYMHGKRQKEIAAQLGLHCSTVSRHISAGMKKLHRAAAIQLASQAASRTAPGAQTP